MLHVSFDTEPDDSVLRAMFAARKRVFVDLLRWDVPVLDDLYEVDQFDVPSARYLVLASRDGDHLGSTRLLPSMRPHILGTLFAHLCEEAVPQADDIFEITRFCLDRRLKARERREVRDTLICALVDHALATGINRYTAIADLGWVQQILSFGWRSRPLGVPLIDRGVPISALEIEIDLETPARLARAGIHAHPHLLVAPADADAREAA